MFSSKMENLKEAAYFDYFKSFSLNAVDTIKKLQNQFKDQISDNFFFQPNNMFKRVKTLLGSYQILVLEINDSCQFVQIPEFGNCILKIFLQIMSVIKFLLKSIIVRASQKQNQRDSILKKDKQRQTTQKQQTPLNNQQKLLYKQKQQSRFMFDNINNELSLLEDQHAMNVQKCNNNLKVIIQGKEKLQSIQVSQNQSILTETLNNFYKKGEHLNNFVNIRQAAMMTNMKQGISDSYSKVKQILDQDSNKKLQNASHRLQQIFKIKIDQHLQEKQNKMISFQCQAVIQDSNEGKLLEQNKQIKKMNELNKKLNGQLKYQRSRIQSLEKLLKQKTQEFQLTTMQYRLSKIQMDTKLSFIKRNTKTESECEDNLTAKNKSVCDSIVLEEMNEDQFDQLNNLQSKQQNKIKEDQINQKTQSKMFQKKIRRVQCRQPRRRQLSNSFENKSQFLTIQNMVSVIKIQPQNKEFQQIQSPLSPVNLFSKKKFGNSRALSSTTQPYQVSNLRQNFKLKNKTVIKSNRILQLISNIFQINVSECKGQSQKYSFPQQNILIKTKKISISDKKQRSPKRTNTQVFVQNQNKQQIQNFQINSLQTYKQLTSKKNSSKQSNFKSNSKNSQNDIQNRQNPIISIQKQTQKQTQKLKNTASSHLVNPNYFKKKQINTQSKESSFHDKSKSVPKKHKHQDSIFQASQSMQHSYIHQIQNNQNIKFKFPRFLKLERPIQMTFNDIQNIFFDQITAQNFQYVNLYQGEEKMNKKHIVQVAQMQKKNLINLLSRVGNQTSKGGNNIAVFSKSKQNNSPHSLSLNNTLTKSSNLWSTLKFGINLSKEMNAYDAQKLSGMVYKQLRDIKKTCKDAHLNNYNILRNFLRYPVSTIKLSKDQKFIQKQKDQPQIQYLELRKIMQRIFKLHANCWKKKVQAIYQHQKFQKLNFPQQNNQTSEGQVKLCEHLIAFYQKIGINLPTIQ